MPAQPKGTDGRTPGRAPKATGRRSSAGSGKIRTNSRRELFLIAYDVADERRLQKVHKIMRDFGEPLQYSVFVAALTAVQRARLEARLLQHIHTKEDQVLFVRLGPVRSDRLTSRRFSTLGLPIAVRDLRRLVY